MTAWTNLTSAGLLQMIIWRGRPLANDRSGALIFWPHTWLLCVQAIIWFVVEFKTYLPFKQTQFSLLQLSDVLALYNWPHIQGVLTVSRAMLVETGRYTGKTHLHSMQWHSAWEISSFLIRYRQDALMLSFERFQRFQFFDHMIKSLTLSLNLRSEFYWIRII